MVELSLPCSFSILFNVRKAQHEKNAKLKKWNLKRVQNGVEIVQHEQSATGKKVQHAKEKTTKRRK